MTAGILANPFEGLVHAAVVLVGENALGLFDDDTALQGFLQLFGGTALLLELGSVTM